MINLIELSGSIAIGAMRWAPESGTDISDADGAYYLRSGIAKSIAGYETAAGLEHMKVSGVATTNATALAVTQSADNGAGTIVACYGNATTVLVSTDSGATWSAVAHNLGGGTAVAVVWTGARFIVSGCTTTNLYTSYSTSGTSFTVGATQAATATANSVRAAWNGATALFVAGGGTGAAFTTTNGTTLTARTLPVSLTVPSIIAGSTTFLIIQASSAAAYSTTDGTSFTARTIPASTLSGAAYIGGLWMVMNSGSVSYYTSPDLAAWTTRAIPYTYSTPGRVTFDSSRVYVGINAITAGILWTSDGITWRVRWTSAKPVGSGLGWHCHSGACLLPTDNSTTVLRIPAWGTADYVGTGQEYNAEGTVAANTMIGYMRLK